MSLCVVVTQWVPPWYPPAAVTARYACSAGVHWGRICAVRVEVVVYGRWYNYTAPPTQRQTDPRPHQRPLGGPDAHQRRVASGTGLVAGSSCSCDQAALLPHWSCALCQSQPDHDQHYSTPNARCPDQEDAGWQEGGAGGEWGRSSVGEPDSSIELAAQHLEDDITTAKLASVWVCMSECMCLCGCASQLTNPRVAWINPVAWPPK